MKGKGKDKGKGEIEMVKRTGVEGRKIEMKN